MITPKFSVRQDETSVYVTIHAAHVRAQSIEFDVEDDQFKFFANPYYLRLTFPGKIVEDEKSTAKFDASSGDILVTLSKQTPGEEFENLDLLSSLLATRRDKEAGEQGEEQPRRPVIEEMNSGAGLDELLQKAYLDEEFDWEIPQALAAADGDTLLVGKAMYGFDQQYSGYLAHVHSTANEVNEVADPETATAATRREQRIANEEAKFDEDYYIDNYIYDEDIQPLINHKSRAYQALRQQPSEPADSAEFTDAEKKIMMDLPRKTYLVSNKQAIYLGLVDILFAYSLDMRSNLDEFTVESAWAIGAVSSTMSNLEQFSTLRSVIVACFRRGLAYPLYRNWELCEHALADVYAICKLGRRAILKVFLELKQLFDQHDIYYVYSKLYLDDYCVWLQTAASDKVIHSLARKVHHFDIDKEEVGWDLDAFEDLALMTSESEAEGDVAPSGEFLREREQPTGRAEPVSKPSIQVIGEASSSTAESEPRSALSDLLALGNNEPDGQDKPKTKKKPLIEIID